MNHRTQLLAVKAETVAFIVTLVQPHLIEKLVGAVDVETPEIVAARIRKANRGFQPATGRRPR